MNRQVLITSCSLFGNSVKTNSENEYPSHLKFLTPSETQCWMNTCESEVMAAFLFIH